MDLLLENIKILEVSLEVFIMSAYSNFAAYYKLGLFNPLSPPPFIKTSVYWGGKSNVKVYTEISKVNLKCNN